MREHPGEELRGRQPNGALRERHDLRDRPSIAVHDQRLACFDAPQHATSVIAKVGDYRIIYEINDGELLVLVLQSATVADLPA